MKAARRTAPAAILAALTLLVAGCGADDDGGSAAPVSTSETAAASATAPATPETAPSGGAAAEAVGSLTIEGGDRAGTYDVTFCFALDSDSLTLGAAGDEQRISVQVSEGTGSLLISDAANTELTNGTIASLSVGSDGAIDASGTYTDGTAFTLGGTCEM